MSLSRQQFTLLGIFALFLGPVLLVILMRSSWWQYQPASLKNHGYLVQPPVRLSLDLARGIESKWLILHVVDLPCDQECIENVTALRQIRRAAGKNGEHLAIVLLGETRFEPTQRSMLESIYPDFYLIEDTSRSVLNTLTSVNTDLGTDTAGLNDIQTYILDPMHNVILAYWVGANPNDMHKDLKRLLKWAD
jgi:hypothetical protein